MAHGWETHDSCPECGAERMTGSMYTSAGGGERVKTGSCMECDETYVTEIEA